MRFKLSILLAISFLVAGAQDPSRFAAEIEELLAKTKDKQGAEGIVFAGSSSFRLWENLESTFPEKTIVNHGFGGSQTSDLICFSALLIANYNPSKIFIYEGDNDLADGDKSVDIVVADFKTLLRVIRRRLPTTPIYIVSPKPSISRWELRDQYVELNSELAALCPKRTEVTFINVWDKMLDDKGELDESLFADDGLHLNETGYKIWAEAIAPHID